MFGLCVLIRMDLLDLRVAFERSKMSKLSLKTALQDAKELILSRPTGQYLDFLPEEMKVLDHDYGKRPNGLPCSPWHQHC